MSRVIWNVWNSVFACGDDVTVMVSNHRHADLIGDTLKEYEAVRRPKINAEKSMGLKLNI